jgi:hypothetical protein
MRTTAYAAVDSYRLPASRFRRRLIGCMCRVPCLGFRCRTPGHRGHPTLDVNAPLIPWCRGGSDELPDGCDDCFCRVVLKKGTAA